MADSFSANTSLYRPSSTQKREQQGQDSTRRAAQMYPEDRIELRQAARTITATGDRRSG
jgi:hypothetical protein